MFPYCCFPAIKGTSALVSMGTACGEDCFKVIVITAGGAVALLGLGIFIMMMCRRKQRKALPENQPPVSNNVDPADQPVHVPVEDAAYPDYHQDQRIRIA